MINIDDLNTNYIVRKLSENDLDIIYNLYKNNYKYFNYLDITPTIQSIIEDMNETPNGMSIDNKYFLGYFNNNELIAIIDLIDGYPNNNEAYIGLFMINRNYQNKHIGTSIFNELKQYLKNQNYLKIRLAYINDNVEAKHFWYKLGFVEDGKTSKLLNKDITRLKLNL